MNADLYKENILDHFRHPRNFGDLPGANAQSRESNILCGDVVEMKLKIDRGRIADIMFRGQGCAISQASASMLTVFSKGKTLNELTRLRRKEIVDLIGTDPGQARIECALLSLRVLKQAIFAYQGKRISEDDACE